jgi:ribose transport system substrate-binding protein
MVTKLEATTATYPVPTASVPGVSSLKGRTVYFVPLLAAIPTFAVAAQTMKAALARAGLSIQVCDAQATPSGAAACVNQATTANAAGIVLDAIPYVMADNALNAAQAKGIPILVADQLPMTPGTASTGKVTYLPGAQDQPSDLAWWTIVDSGGKANEIFAQENDNPSAIAAAVSGQGIIRKYCPGCALTVKPITATTNALLASATSANILAHPGIDYYYTQYEDSLQPTIQGIQQSGKSGISLSVAAGTVDGLGLLKGNSVVKAVEVVDEAYEGWALTDEILRMATKTAPVTETIPDRLFSKDNVGSIQITPAAQASGVWFGDTSYQGEFAKLWGVR